jgi:hypothetical protein
MKFPYYAMTGIDFKETWSISHAEHRMKKTETHHQQKSYQGATYMRESCEQTPHATQSQLNNPSLNLAKPQNLKFRSRRNGTKLLLLSGIAHPPDMQRSASPARL